MDKKSFAIVILAALVQYYDYHLFGFMAVKISYLFFPSNSPVESLSKAYFIIFLSYLTKPFGAILLGRIGDVVNKSAALTVSLVCTSLASLVISFIPTYETWGVVSIFILIIARMVTSSCVGPGTDGIRLYIFEHITLKHRYLGEGCTTASCLLGSFIAASSASFFSSSSAPLYGWRIAFFIGFLMGVALVVIKHFFPIHYPALQNTYQENTNDKHLGILSITKKYWKLFILGAITSGTIGASYQFLTIFWGQYNADILNIVANDVVFYYLPYTIILFMVGSILAGFIADSIGSNFSASLGFFAIVIILASNFMALNAEKFYIFNYLSIGLMLPFLVNPAHVSLKRVIPISVRHRVYSLSHSIGSICISGSTSFVATKLYQYSNVKFLPLLYFALIIISMFLSFKALNKIHISLN